MHKVSIVKEDILSGAFHCQVSSSIEAMKQLRLSMCNLREMAGFELKVDMSFLEVISMSQTSIGLKVLLK